MHSFLITFNDKLPSQKMLKGTSSSCLVKWEKSENFSMFVGLTHLNFLSGKVSYTYCKQRYLEQAKSSRYTLFLQLPNWELEVFWSLAQLLQLCPGIDLLPVTFDVRKT